MEPFIFFSSPLARTLFWLFPCWNPSDEISLQASALGLYDAGADHTARIWSLTCIHPWPFRLSPPPSPALTFALGDAPILAQGRWCRPRTTSQENRTGCTQSRLPCTPPLDLCAGPCLNTEPNATRMFDEPISSAKQPDSPATRRLQQEHQPLPCSAHS
jgi:hypothetical protein